MEILTLLGAILDLTTMSFINWDSDDNGNYQVNLTEDDVHDLKHIAESLLDVEEDVDEVNYNDVTIIFENGRVSKVLYGDEEHNVRKCVDCYVKAFDLEVIYTAMCAKVLSLLKWCTFFERGII